MSFQFDRKFRAILERSGKIDVAKLDELRQLGSAPQDVVSADFNNDGILDLAVACRLASQVDVFAGLGADGRGDGTFEDVSAATGLDDPAWTTSVALADLDLDGDLDLALRTLDHLDHRLMRQE